MSKWEVYGNSTRHTHMYIYKHTCGRSSNLYLYMPVCVCVCVEIVALFNVKICQSATTIAAKQQQIHTQIHNYIQLNLLTCWCRSIWYSRCIVGSGQHFTTTTQQTSSNLTSIWAKEQRRVIAKVAVVTNNTKQCHTCI